MSAGPAAELRSAGGSSRQPVRSAISTRAGDRPGGLDHPRWLTVSSTTTHPTPVGPASVTADHMQEWFEAEAVDGFWLLFDVYEDAIDTFVDEVVPLLQERGIYHLDYEGATLRENLGAHQQYGLDHRLGSSQ